MDLIYKTQKEIRGFNVYDDDNAEKLFEAYSKDNLHNARQAQCSAVLKDVVDGYNEMDQENRYQFRRKVRTFVKWYDYLTQITRPFDPDLHKEYLFCSYLGKLLPGDPSTPLDKLRKNTKVRKSAENDDPKIFLDSTFAKEFDKTAQDSYMESMETYSKMFEDMAKYKAIKDAIAAILFDEFKRGA